MSIKIYNTLTRKKEEFIPITPAKVGMYVCGVTVYDECHIGHARSAIVFDIIRRYFKYRGYEVKFVKNITDIDDKIIDKAHQFNKILSKTMALKERCQWVVDKFLKFYYKDMKNLGVEKPDIEPRATQHIPDMIKLIENLIKKGYAYNTNGNVYFSIGRFKDYGKLSNQNIERILSGVRVDLEEDKKDKLDFALWKSAKDDEPYWESPWGNGRPGWHIECSTMSMKYLGENFDIHGGGIDLVFPHHENEIAQSESGTGKTFANYWLHNGLLSVNGEKMSKSLGNFISVSDIMADYTPEVLRLFFISSHYASPQDFTYEKMDEQKKALERFYILFTKIDSYLEKANVKREIMERILDDIKQKIDSFKNSFIDAMDDDFNTALASGFLFDLLTFTNKVLDDGTIAPKEKYYILRYAKKVILELGSIFGLFSKTATMTKEAELVKDLIGFLIELREGARKNKDFKTADLIRQRLLKMGFILEDTKENTTFRDVR
ncbi:MAG: cysteine--tRNA ligase [Candidatus Omnitrophica bacterium]|nr:cysteine--tRNA ligase [Candidatus Omnitrophota bacterium]